ncbi:TonB-dependent receptor domain-containing protein [Flavobacterium sp. 7A]|uniref:TonB-dependent receptor domain-containing protein n=1 Tax=Flavobacterium sp. 7A TaxID=2940571 RepID=UPI0022263F76|nr:TonB-dependent receptor [Flavobacterium sp. 7A]MCW2118961.1 Fe(3+) dicitrate transport protein [Flavobacterium sp. 7A]
MKALNTKLGFSLLMTPSKAYKVLLLLLLSINSFAQHKIAGTVTDEKGSKLSAVEVFNKTTGAKEYTNASGQFEFNYKNQGSHDIVFFKSGYSIVEQISITTGSELTIVLSKINNLSEVIIRKQNDKLQSIRKLNDIEETAIYAGKKTEVINVEKLTANKSTNNARQVFAQVVGLTINESSDGGLQLSIGGRGLNPNRTANFNTRQNGYDISADVLGYPESYYATPTEALEEIQVIRGAASLQYGTQFGGLINFKIKTPALQPIEVVTRNTIGSYGLYTNFTSLSGTKGKFSYYTFFNYKKGNGYRPNSNFESKNYFANLNYKFNDKTSLHFDYTYYHYLAQQAGGLTDEQFNENPRQSNRTRNWFGVNWNLYALRLKHRFDENSDFSLQLFGLNASRKALGFRDNRITTPDPMADRDLIIGDFVNWGAEARYLKRYYIGEQKSAFLIGAKYYQSRNTQQQGPGSSGSNADFNIAIDEFPNYQNQSSFIFPNLNLALFGENIFKINSNFTITPGFRIEKIKTQAQGTFQKINKDLAGNLILNETTTENIAKDRNLFLLGVGVSYKPKNGVEIYGNVSQNYRSVTFSDIFTVNASQAVDPNITDEKGYTSDIGIRGNIAHKLNFDSSIFGLYYNDKIGQYDGTNALNQIVKITANTGTAFTYGFETLLDWNIAKTYFADKENLSWNVFTNSSITGSSYLKSNIPSVKKGDKVEFVPLYNIKTGTSFGYKNFLSSIQFTYLSSQLSSASSNSSNNVLTGISGSIPSYYVADISTSYKWKNFKLEAGINNFTDNSYFTRRATGYPGPGIIPSDRRTFYTTLQYAF